MHPTRTGGWLSCGVGGIGRAAGGEGGGGGRVEGGRVEGLRLLFLPNR